MATDPLKYRYDTDRYQWQPGHHWWPVVVSAAEGSSPFILHRVEEELRVS